MGPDNTIDDSAQDDFDFNLFVLKACKVLTPVLFVFLALSPAILTTFALELNWPIGRWIMVVQLLWVVSGISIYMLRKKQKEEKNILIKSLELLVIKPVVLLTATGLLMSGAFFMDYGDGVSIFLKGGFYCLSGIIALLSLADIKW